MKTLPLTQGKVALVSDRDYPRVSGFKWHTDRKGKRFYAARNIYTPKGRRILYLHRALLPQAREVDHRDGDGLNCQRRNLRKCSTQQNRFGFRRKIVGASSTYRGVTWVAALDKWCAQITFNRKRIYLGVFVEERNAACAYNQAAKKLFGRFAHLNKL